MPEDLLDSLVAELNLASSKLGEMHKAVVQLLSELTRDEMTTWNQINERLKQHHEQMNEAFLEVNVLRTTDPDGYFGRMAALLERDADEIRMFTRDIMNLVNNHKPKKPD